MVKEKAKISLIVLAAGIGSRFGGIKQLSHVGPKGETIIDYSLYDAFQAGFKKIIFVIRREIEADFRAIIGHFWEGFFEVDYIYQELDSLLPMGWPENLQRSKPWGTGHALLVARDRVQEPFAVINADDFYGRRAFEVMVEFLVRSSTKAGEKDLKPEYALVGYRLKQTLSDFGPVSRGLCQLQGDEISDIQEMKHIEKTEGGARARLEDGGWLDLDGEEVVSMNFWGFDPSIFNWLQVGFFDFLNKYGHDPKAEFLIPEFIGELLRQRKVKVFCLPTDEKWLGITYAEDLPVVRKGIGDLVAQGYYPENLRLNLEMRNKK